MASLELRNQTYRVVFMLAGRKYGYSLDTGDLETAHGLRGGVEKTLMLIRQGVLRLPERGDIAQFVKNDGKVVEPTKPAPAPITFGDLKTKYLETHSNGVMEANSLATVAMHLRHFENSLGPRFQLQNLSLADLQSHVTRRARKKYRGKSLSPVTLRKEIASFRAAWNWSMLDGLVKGVFPSRGLVYPKTDEKPPFMTWTEIERRIASCDLTAAEQADLWDCLYLRKPEIDQFLTYVREHATHPWVFPLICTAAHTGARRSELLRMDVNDVNFDTDQILVREKKRNRRQRTTRYVSLTPFLKAVLQDWLAGHPGGKYLFCHSEVVARSKSAAAQQATREKKPGPVRRGAARPRSGFGSGRCQGPSPRTRSTTISAGRWPAASGRCSAGCTSCVTVLFRVSHRRVPISGSLTSGPDTVPTSNAGVTGTCSPM